MNLIEAILISGHKQANKKINNADWAVNSVTDRFYYLNDNFIIDLIFFGTHLLHSPINHSNIKKSLFFTLFK